MWILDNNFKVLIGGIVIEKCIVILVLNLFIFLIILRVWSLLVEIIFFSFFLYRNVV